MILLAFILLVSSIIYHMYFFVAYRKRSLKGEVALIAGRNGSLFRSGASIFAKHLLLELAGNGCDFILIDTAENETSLKELKEELEEKTGAVSTVLIADIADKGAVAKIAHQIMKQGDNEDEHDAAPSKVDLLFTIPCFVNISPRSANSDVKNHQNMIQTFLPGMSERKHGHVVTVAGTSGLFGLGAETMQPRQQFEKEPKINESVLLCANVAKNMEDCSNSFGLIGLAESLFFSLQRSKTFGNKIKTTLICSSEIDKIRHQEEYVDQTTLSQVDAAMFRLAKRTVEAVQRGEERVVLPWTVWLCQILKLLPLTWMEKLLDRWSVLGVFSDEGKH